MKIISPILKMATFGTVMVSPAGASVFFISPVDGSTSTEITLEPGAHTLQMLLGDHLHIPHDSPIMSGPITIIVE